MDAIRDGFVRGLLRQTVIALGHVALHTSNESGEQSQLVDPSTLVFTLANGRRFELMAAQISDLGIAVFTEVPTDADLLTAGDLEREPEEHATLVDAEPMGAPLPWRVASITEVWLPDQNPPFLFAIILWSRSRQPLLALHTATDDIVAPPLNALQEELLSLPFYCGSVLHHWYDA